MRHGKQIAAIIPALNEERSLGSVLKALPPWMDDVIVADNGSTDGTSRVATEHGARVISQPRRGYGSACLAALAALDCPDVVVFLDGDFSDHPEEADRLVDPIVAGRADMVLGSRVLGEHEPGALTPQAVFGNRLACRLIRLFWNTRFTDLGPFRAIDYRTLQRLDMRDPDYGWTVEMQIKAAKRRLRVLEVPVSYRRRVGKSKVSGTVRGVIGAGTKILGTIALAALGLLPGAAGKPWERTLIIFTRYPEPGRTKTRLIPLLSPAGAADLHRRMTEYTVDRMRGVSREPSTALQIFYEGGDLVRLEQWLGHDLAYQVQGGGDLGLRMLNAFRKSFRDGMERTVIVGTDCPDLSAAVVERAFLELESHDVVVGPAADGGYYLIGARRPHPVLFTGIPWGTEEVLKTSLRIAKDLGLSVGLLDTLHDVDRPEDIHRWKDTEAVRTATNRRLQEPASRTTLGFARTVDYAGDPDVAPGAQASGATKPQFGSLFPTKPSRYDQKMRISSTVPDGSIQGRSRPRNGPYPVVSVIIPTLNEEEHIRSALGAVISDDRAEIVAVDGGSTDQTEEILRANGVDAFHSSGGRSGQMNAGAHRASGEILLFLHADTVLPDGWYDHVLAAFDSPDVVGGAFRLSLDADFLSLRIIESLANLRTGRLRMPYGDQAIFLRKEAFERIGGFPAIPIMEDVELVRKLRRLGRLKILSASVLTSARRWRNLGIWRTTVINQLVIFGHSLGIPGDALARFYHQDRTK